MQLIDKIKELKKAHNAVILAHNYQLPEIQDIADFTGDSLGLSMQAARTNKEVLIFCGVSFMAETAKILSPGKTVLIPEPQAGCPLAEMISEAQLITLKQQHPQAQVVCYVNTSAAIKALSDVCCTSANAVAIVQKVLLDTKDIIFVPDKYLAHYVSQQVHAPLIAWHGYCPTHLKIRAEDIHYLKMQYPHAEVLVHPECNAEVLALADAICSTEKICTWAKKSKKKEFIIGTELGLLHKLRKDNPDKIFLPVTDKAVCPNMKKTTLEKLLWCLEEKKHEVIVPEPVQQKAAHSIRRMHETISSMAQCCL